MSKELAISETVEKLTGFIYQQQDHFVQLNENCINRLDFAKECEFARQQLMKNGFTLDVARQNPDSLYTAISNVAAIGISLNPAMAFAYLVPRKVNNQQSICLDISYRGLIKLATDTGIIKAMKAELVYENDKFEYHGFHQAPDFAADPFGDRGELRGVYAMALLADGNVLVETMKIEDVNEIRDDSEAYKKAVERGGWHFENNVWVKYYTEMVKKTVIKRAYKTLPTSKGTEIMGKAIEVINEHEGIEFDKPPQIEVTYTDEQIAEYRRCVAEDDYFNLVGLCKHLDADSQLQLRKLCLPEPEKGQKGKVKAARQEKTDDATMRLEAAIHTISEMIEQGDDPGVAEILSDCSTFTIDFILSKLSTEQQIAINQIQEAA